MAKHHWLKPFVDALHPSPGFVAAMDLGLRDHTRQLLGADVLGKAQIMPPVPDPFAVANHGRKSVLECNLIVREMGYWATIGWENLAGDTPVPPGAADFQARFYWTEFPITDIKEALGSPSPALPLPDYPFAVAQGGARLPHIRLDMAHSGAFTAEQLTEINQGLAAMQDQWNSQGKGLIHNLHRLAPDGPGRLSLKTDLGSAGVEGLAHLIDTLAKLGVAITALRLANW